jgi:hypothetical protein
MTENISYALRYTMYQQKCDTYQSTSRAARNKIYILNGKINLTANENFLYNISSFELVKI